MNVKRVCLILIMSAFAVGGAFAQVVVGAGLSLDSRTEERKAGGTTDEWGNSEFQVDLNIGYRMGLTIGLIGGGIDASFGGYEVKSDNPHNTKYSNIRIGGYFEYAFLNTQRLAFFGKIGLGYIGRFDIDGSTYSTLGDTSGFYLDVAPMFEFRVSPNVSVFASIPLISFSISTYEDKKTWDSTDDEWVDLPSDYSYKDTRTRLSFPITQGLGQITLGLKFLF